MHSVQIGFHWICIASLIDLEKILAVERKDLLKSKERQSETKLGIPQEVPAFQKSYYQLVS